VDPFKTDKTVYTPHEFLLWRENGMLDLTPKFQRRPVWRIPAKSFFIDTILRGMTVPPIYLRNTQNDKKTRCRTDSVCKACGVRAADEHHHPAPRPGEDRLARLLSQQRTRRHQLAD